MHTEKQIKELAYTMWEQEGRPEGKDVEHYFAAEQILKERGAAQECTSQPEATPPALVACRRQSRGRKR